MAGGSGTDEKHASEAYLLEYMSKVHKWDEWLATGQRGTGGAWQEAACSRTYMSGSEVRWNYKPLAKGPCSV
eukprot:333746-Pelagomonas_calceolata.AAC.5